MRNLIFFFYSILLYDVLCLADQRFLSSLLGRPVTRLGEQGAQTKLRGGAKYKLLHRLCPQSRGSQGKEQGPGPQMPPLVKDPLLGRRKEGMLEAIGPGPKYQFEGGFCPR